MNVNCFTIYKSTVNIKKLFDSLEQCCVQCLFLSKSTGNTVETHPTLTNRQLKFAPCIKRKVVNRRPNNPSQRNTEIRIE